MRNVSHCLKFGACLALVATATAVEAARGTGPHVFFTSTFDAYSGPPPWPTNSPEWHVRDGTVTLVDSGSPSRGKYIDLGGSTGDPGVLYIPFELFSGFDYVATFELADCLAGAGSDVTVQYGTATKTIHVAPGSPFTTYSIKLEPAVEGSGLFDLSFSSASATVAPRLDNVVLTSYPVPEASATWMALAGAMLAGMSARRAGAMTGPRCSKRQEG